MKTRIHTSFLPLVSIALAASLNPALLLQAEARQAVVHSGPADIRNANGIETQIMRASVHLGHDILASDGQKVGDVVDFAFDLRDTPRLAYVLSITGGFLDLGGDVRAIPAHALQWKNGALRIDLDKAQYNSLAVLDGSRRQYLEVAAHRTEIDRIFGRGTDQGDNRVNRQAGEPVSIRLYSEIEGRDVLSREGERLGVVDDAWVSLDAGRVPYLEVDPQQTDQIFTVIDTGTHYVVPLDKLDPNATQPAGAVTFALSEEEVRSAESVSEQEGVLRISSDTLGNLVLQVTLPAEGASDQRSARNQGAAGNSRYGAETASVQVPGTVALAPDDVSDATLRHYAGQPVRTAGGREIGTVQDFVLNAGADGIAGVIVSTGGFMGVGGRQHLMPAASLRRDVNRDGFTVQIDEQEFRRLPVVAEADNNEGWFELTADERDAINGVFGADGLKSREGDGRHVRLSSLRGRTVRNHGGEIGEIEAIVIDPHAARAAVVLDPNDSLADGDRKFLVPLAQLAVGEAGDNQTLTTEVPLDEFRRLGESAYQTLGRES